MRELLDTRVGLSLEVGVRSLRHEARTAGPGLASGGKGGVDAFSIQAAAWGRGVGLGSCLRGATVRRAGDESAARL